MIIVINPFQQYRGSCTNKSCHLTLYHSPFIIGKHLCCLNTTGIHSTPCILSLALSASKYGAITLHFHYYYYYYSLRSSFPSHKSKTLHPVSLPWENNTIRITHFTSLSPSLLASLNMKHPHSLPITRGKLTRLERRSVRTFITSLRYTLIKKKNAMTISIVIWTAVWWCNIPRVCSVVGIIGKGGGDSVMRLKYICVCLFE